MRPSMNKVEDLLKSKQNCIWINTYEENEVIKDLQDLLSTEINTISTMYVWSNTEGLVYVPLKKGETKIDTDVRLREIPALFAKIRENIANDSKNKLSTVYVLRDLHSLINDPRTRRCIRDIYEYNTSVYSPLIVISPVTEIHDDIARLFEAVDYGLPDKKRLDKLLDFWSEQINKVNTKNNTVLYHDISKQDRDIILNAVTGLTVIEINNLMIQSLKQFNRINTQFILDHKIEKVKKSGLLDYKIPSVSLDDIGGHIVFKQYLQELIQLFSPEAKSYGLEMPKGLLLLGLAGTGKTQVAEAMAGSLKVPLLSLNLAKIMSRFVGESEQKIEASLKIAEASAPCVVLLDEVEKMLGGNC